MHDCKAMLKVSVVKGMLFISISLTTSMTDVNSPARPKAKKNYVKSLSFVSCTAHTVPLIIAWYTLELRITP